MGTPHDAILVFTCLLLFLFRFVQFLTSYNHSNLEVCLQARNVGERALYGKFYPKKVIQKKLSTNKSSKKYYPEVLSKNCFIQYVRDLFYITLYSHL